MNSELALIAEGGGMRGAYVYGAMKALDEVFNDQFGLLNFKYMAGTSASALTLLYTVAEQFHSDGLDIWSSKVTRKRFLDDKAIKRLLVGPSILDVEYLVDEIFAKEHPLNLKRVLNSKNKFYFPLVDVKDLSLKYYTNDFSLSDALLPYELIHMDHKNPKELYSVMKATAAAPIAFNKDIEIQGRKYIDGVLLAPFPMSAPIPQSAKRVVILTKPEPITTRWWRDRLIPSIAKGGFFHGEISNSKLYDLISEECKNYEALTSKLSSTENCFVIKPDVEISSSDNHPEVMKRNLKKGFQDVMAQKEALQAFIAGETLRKLA